MNEKWRLARYLIAAKKAVDNMLYISQHMDEIYDVDNEIDIRKSIYFRCCCAVLDNSICKRNKKNVQLKYNFVEYLYYHRDKCYAHKDINYIPFHPFIPYRTFEDEIKDYARYVNNLVAICKNYLPDNLTLDFVYYDGKLYRMLNKISAIDEKFINVIRYPLYGVKLPGDERLDGYKEFNNIDYLQFISESEKSKHYVTCYDGLTLEEGLQNRQDWCIRANCLFDLDMWCSMKSNVIAKGYMTNECYTKV